MPDTPLRAMLRRLRRVLGQQGDSSVTDAQLLERFLAADDEAAFELLVRRHERMVWGVCRRLLHDPNDAEDAFQATFLILLRKAASIRKQASMAGWLYQVAYRVGLRVKANLTRRAVHEQTGVDLCGEVAPGDPTTEVAWRDLKPLLEQAINALPAKYREAVVLCYLEGKTYAEAAELLDCPRGTVSIRLTRARDRLRVELAKHGLTLPAALLTTALCEQAAGAAVPAVLVRSVMTAATLVAAGQAETDVIPVKVSALTEGVLKSMALTKHKTAAVVLLAVGVLGVGIGASGLLRPTRAAEGRTGPSKQTHQAAAPRAAVVEPGGQPKAAAKPAGEGKMLVWRETKFVFVTSDGKEAGELPGHPDKLILNQPVLSPDGKRVAFTVNETPPTDENGNHRRHVFVRALDGKDPGFKLAINAASVAWTSDGKGLVVAEFLTAKELKDRGFDTWLVDVDTKKQTRLDLPRSVHAFRMIPDGKAFVAAVYDLDAQKAHLALVSRDGKDTTQLTEIRNEDPDPKPSPDGTRVLFQDFDPADKPEKGVPRLRRLFVYDLRAKTRERLADLPLNGDIFGYCWSPDGKQVAYTWKQVHPGVPLAVNRNNENDPKLNAETESHLIVADANGKNARTVMSAKANYAPTITIGSVDWR